MKKILFAMLTFLGITSCSNAQDCIPTLAPKEFAEMLAADTTAVLMDVRTLEEYKTGYLEGVKIQLDYLQESVFAEGIKKLAADKTYYIYCRSGRRSHGAAEKMKALGLKVVDMKGGILAWNKAEMPIVVNLE